jgi:hypothetical protein
VTTQLQSARQLFLDLITQRVIQRAQKDPYELFLEEPMIYPRYYYFKTQTLKRKKNDDEDVNWTWECAKSAYNITAGFPPIVYTFYDDYVEFVSYENFSEKDGFDQAAKFLTQQMHYNQVMRGGAVVFRSFTERLGIACLFFWKKKASLFRIAKDGSKPLLYKDYIYTDDQYCSDEDVIDPKTWLPWMFKNTLATPIASSKNTLGDDDEKLIDFLWKAATHEIKRPKNGKIAIRPILALIYHDIFELYDLSPFVYSDLAGFGLAPFIDEQLNQHGVRASAIILAEQEEKDEHYLVLRYSTNDLYIIRTSKVMSENVLGQLLPKISPYEESIAYGKTS